MKLKTILPIFLLLFALLQPTFAQVKEDAIVRFYEKYMNDERFSTMYFSGRMFRMMANTKEGDKESVELAKAASQIDGLRMLSSDNVNGLSLYKEVIQNLNRNGFEELMVVRENNEEFQFLIREEKGIVKELLMISAEGKSFMLLSIIGNIDLNSISKITKQLDIKGLDKF
jgi:hypothetical protein